MAKGLRSKRERRNRAAIRDKRTAWREEQLEKILSSKDTPTLPYVKRMRKQQRDAEASMDQTSANEETPVAEDSAEVAMGDSCQASSAATSSSYIHFTHSEKKQMKKRMRHRNQLQQQKIMKKVMKNKQGSSRK